MPHHRFFVTTVALSVAVLTLAASQASAQPNAATGRDGQPTSAVALGDGFASGEGGRWLGNAPAAAPLGGDVWGTDRSAYGCSADHSTCERDVARVYGDSTKDGCDRSDISEVESADLGVDRRFNLACAGGGVTARQLDQLAAVASATRVRVVFVSVGGGDAPLAGLTAEGIRKAQPGVEDALAGVRGAMTKAGYGRSDYRLILQSYPSPVPRSAENKYPDSAVRGTAGGCPLTDVAADRVRNETVPALAAMGRSAATAQGAEFLDLQDAFQGHEVCAETAKQAQATDTLDAPVDAATAEWVRFVPPAPGPGSGTAGEALHPNAFGQEALGRCLTLLWHEAPGGHYACDGTPDVAPTDMIMAPEP